MTIENDKGGRPPKYRKIYDKIAYQMALLGATDKMLAEALGVNVDTVHDWKQKHKGFSDSIRRGKLPADGQAAHGLFKRAVGFSYNEVTYEKIGPLEALEAEGDEEMMTEAYRKKIVRKMVAPDPGAASKWLNNRQKDLWRDKQVVEFEHMTDAQLEKIIEDLKKAAYEQDDQG